MTTSVKSQHLTGGGKPPTPPQHAAPPAPPARGEWWRRAANGNVVRIVQHVPADTLNRVPLVQFVESGRGGALLWTVSAPSFINEFERIAEAGVDADVIADLTRLWEGIKS